MGLGTKQHNSAGRRAIRQVTGQPNFHNMTNVVKTMVRCARITNQRQIIWALKREVTMIKVTGSNVTDSEVEVIVTACRFFLDRLLPTVQQKKLVLDAVFLTGLI